MTTDTTFCGTPHVVSRRLHPSRPGYLYHGSLRQIIPNKVTEVGSHHAMTHECLLNETPGQGVKGVGDIHRYRQGNLTLCYCFLFV